MVRFSTRMNLLKGSAIRELLALANKPEILSFAGGMPAPELFPVDKIKAATDAVLRSRAKSRSSTPAPTVLSTSVSRSLTAWKQSSTSKPLLITSS